MTNLFGEFFGTMVLMAFGGGVCANLSLAKAKGNRWRLDLCQRRVGICCFDLVHTHAIALGAPQADLNPAVTLFKMFAGTYASSSGYCYHGCSVAWWYCWCCYSLVSVSSALGSH
jgi:glycerol uptake facilitator protein